MAELHWSTAKLPPNTAVFALGDIHSHDQLLKTLFGAIEKKIATLPDNASVYVIPVGDYVDRGPSAPGAIEEILSFQKRIAERNARGEGPNVILKCLCGNHEWFIKNLLDSSRIIEREDVVSPGGFEQFRIGDDGAISLTALEDALFKGNASTTFLDYLPGMDESLFDYDNKQFNRTHPDFSIETVNALVDAFKASVPESHRAFWNSIYDANHVTLGQYLFVHAGVHPTLDLASQGINAQTPHPQGEGYLEQLMIRNPFLWRDDLPSSPDHVVIHGHTPTAILNGRQSLMADGQKSHRLCIDTGVYEPHGALTCFFRHDDKAEFMAVEKAFPHEVHEYCIPKVSRHLAMLQHREKFPQFHSGHGRL